MRPSVHCLVVELADPDKIDIAVYVSALQRHATKPLIEHYIKINKVLKWVKRKKSPLFYGKLSGP